jgi:hypothetical protein
MPKSLHRPLLALTCLLMAAINFTPQLLQATHGRQGAFFYTDDEPHYAARVTRAMQGDWSGGEPWVREHVGEAPVVPPLAENLIGGAARAWNALFSSLAPLTPDRVVAGSRAVLPTLSFLAFYLLLAALGMTWRFRLFIAAFVFFEPYAGSYTPFSGWLIDAHRLGVDRFLNPMFPLILFFATLATGARAFLATRDPAKNPRAALPWAALAGGLLGLHFYISVFYWTHLALTFFFSALLFSNRRAWWVFGVGALAAAAVALPYVMTYLESRGQPAFLDVAWRNALLLRERPWYSLPNKRLWLLFAASLTLWRHRRALPGVRLLLAGILGGVSCYYSSLVTGITLQNFHWHYTLAPLLWTGALWAAWLELRDRLPTLKRPPAYALAVTLVLVNAASLALNHRHAYDALAALPPTFGQAVGSGLHDQSYFEAWAWLREHAPSGSVILADEATMPAIPTRTGLYVWNDMHLNVDRTPMTEIRERYALLWGLKGLSGEALRKWMTFPAGLDPAWPFGLTDTLWKELIAASRPPFYPPLRLRVSEEIIRDQDSMNPDRLRALARKYRADFLVRGPNETADWSTMPETVFRLEPAGNFGGVRVDRILGVRDSQK